METRDYKSDEALQEIHDEMYNQGADKQKGLLSGISPEARMMIGVCVGVLALMVFFHKITMKNAGLLLVAGAIVFFLMRSGEPKKTELTWLECMMRINDLLKFLQDHPIGQGRQVPKGEIHIKPIGRKQWYDGKSWKRSYAVDLHDDDMDTVEMYFVEVDVFTGDIITFRHSPEGVYGDETKDVKIIPSPEIFMQKKRDQFMHKSYKL